MIHAKSDSDITSLAPSSPSRHAYYVQTPSGESEPDKSSTLHATPVYATPTDSPSHPSHSASSRFSGNFPGKSKNRSAAGANRKGWPECKVIEEEGVYDDDKGGPGVSRCCQVLIAVAVFVVVFAAFCFIIWGASRPYKPEIVVKSLLVENFYYGEGSDHTGVPTKMITVNCSLKMNVYNPASTFGIHVTSSQISLFYSQIAIATGQLQKYYQPRKSHHSLAIVLEGDKVPLYGAGVSLAMSTEGTIPLTLDFIIFSRANVVGRLVMVKHRRNISCRLVLDSNRDCVRLSLNSCHRLVVSLHNKCIDLSSMNARAPCTNVHAPEFICAHQQLGWLWVPRCGHIAFVCAHIAMFSYICAGSHTVSLAFPRGVYWKLIVRFYVCIISIGG